MMHKAKKSLGQNFLKSEIALRKIIEAGEIKLDDVILEIGPGKGALTEKLLEKAGVVIAVEKDYELFEFLKEKFSEEIKSKSLLLIQGDILEFQIKDYELRNYKIIANIPYNITGAILKKFLTEKHQPECMVLLVQHEVATRIIARDGKESILSISVKAYGEPKMIMKVGARYFSPAPKVDSAIILIKKISRKNFTSPLTPLLTGEGGQRPDEVNEEKFWEIVKTGFAHKRKKLSRNLKSLRNYEDYEKNIESGNLGNKRAEELTLSDWIALAK
jgi:16S rRNA (adenine1518-N6/adenine1519-N6)-dimethyltransferase